MASLSSWWSYATGNEFDSKGEINNCGVVQYSYPFAGQCVSLIQGYMKYNGCTVCPRGNAIDWWRNFNSNGLSQYFTKQSSPQNGDVVVTNADPDYGHIGIYKDGQLLQQNYAQYPYARFLPLSVSGSPYGYLRPKFLSSYSDSQLINEHAYATLKFDVQKRRDTPTGLAVETLKAGRKLEYTQKWVGNGHRFISWVEHQADGHSYRYFVAVNGNEQGTEPWATFEPLEQKVDLTEEHGWAKANKGTIDMSNVKHWGVDISELNDDVNLSKYDFAIIRACYGEYTDKKLAQWVNECNRLGIPFGLYCYDYALNDDQALAEAKYILKLAEQYQPTLGIWFDMEDADNYKKKNGVLTAERCLKSCQIFCKAVKDAGWYTGVYSSTWWFDNWLTSGLDDYDKWVAQWDANDGDYHSDTSSMGTIHQYTSVDKHSGIGLDKNAMYVDFDHYKVKVDKPSEEKPSEPQKEPTDDKKELSGMLKTLIGLLKKLLSVFGKSGD